MRYIDMKLLSPELYNRILHWLIDDNIEYTYELNEDDFIVIVNISDEDAIIMRLKLSI